MNNGAATRSSSESADSGTLLEMRGEVTPDFTDFAALFERILAEKAGGGVAVCAYVSGVPVVDLWGGDTYGQRTMQLLFSTTKGLTAIVFGRLLESGLVDFDEPVASYWPEFGAHGKARLTVGDMLAHRGGLPAPDRQFSLSDWADGTLAAALAEQKPLWTPGSGHGYHAITYGVLANELAKRVGGRSVGQILREEVTAPLEADAFIGLPADRQADVAPVLRQSTEVKPSRSGKYGAVAAQHRPYSLDDPDAWNDQAFHALEFPAVNGIASARALAKIYAACLESFTASSPILKPGTVAALVAQRSAGVDLVGGVYTRFGAGFQLRTPLWPMSGEGAFGHDGFGGCVAFADPALDISFAYTTDRVPAIGGVDPVCQSLVSAVVALADG